MRIYIAGPLTADPGRGIREALKAANVLLQAGHAPYVPHLTWLWDLVYANSYEAWMRLDLAWLAQAEAVLRLDGDSPGADREVQRALELDIPVFRGDLGLGAILTLAGRGSQEGADE